MATDIDLKVISNFASVSEATLTSLLSSPTSDSVKSLFEAVEKNARECERNKSQKVKLEVELETVVRTNESKVKVLQNSRDKALGDVQKLRGDLQAVETNRTKIESELEQLRTASSSEASEVTTLKSRVASLEASNRDTLSLLESKTSAYDKLSQDLSVQHQKSTELRKQVASLEQAAQSSHSAAASAKFREQSLQQEIDLLKKNNEWLENERKLKADEHTAFRKEKNARISELSRSNEQNISDVEALKRSEASLKQRLEENLNKFEDLQQDMQKLREEKIADEDANKIDLEGQQRLNDLQRASLDTQKQRVQELSLELEDVREEAAETIGEIRAAAETDHLEKEAAIRKITELEATIAQLQADIEQERARPSTPQRPANGNAISTPMRPSTPLGIFSPGTRGMKSVTQTQMFSEYKRVEQELASVKHENEDLRGQIDDMITQLEQSKPELDEISADYDKQRHEIVEMSSLVDAANKEKDEAARSARIAHGQLDARVKEVGILQQQLRDLSSQLRRLVMEINVLNEGGRMTKADWAELHRKSEEDTQTEMEGLSNTQRIVNERLIAFKNISELQQQNQDQLATIRNLVDQLESRDLQEKQEKFVAMEQELEVCRAQIAGFQDEIKTMVAQSKSFVKERDMFRNMLTRKGRLEDVNDFSRSLPIPPGGSPGKANSINGGDSDLTKVIKELQQQFDYYRSETLVDQSSLKTQVDNLSKRNSELQHQASRLQGQLSAATQRAEMLQSNYNMLKTENSEVQKRSYAAMENATKQELRVQQAAEDLVETKGMNDSLQRESANLKAEKDLWKSVEKRLLEDNESLRNERGRLDQLNSSLQTIISEREQADSETRRRLQAQAESLESELQTIKRKLNDEQEENRKASLRRQYEQDQNQKRVDDLIASLGSLREELAAAKTSRDHLQARVDELTVELRAAEERLDVYTKPPGQQSDDTAEEDSVAREQELTLEVTDLKRELELKKADLDRATEQIDTYKEIAQSVEERLQEVGETHDDYKEVTEASLSEKDTKIKELKQRVEEISEELQTTNSELSNLRDEQQGVDRRLEEQKTLYESQIERLKESEATALEQANFNLDATKAQYAIAETATKNYEDELLKHAAAADDLRTMRGEANKLRLEMVDLKTQAETAQTSLRQKESSWSEQKDRYEQELSDIKSRREELSVQNNRLHEQLESLTKQVTALKQDRAALADDSDRSSNDPNLENLQEVIKYLRQEKQIVDQQYHNTSHTLKGVQQKLEFTQAQLDETRLKLDQQRRSELDSERNAMSHNKMMELLDSVNLHRESNVTLRAENKQLSETLAGKTKRVEELEAQIQPLQARVAELDNLVETRDGEMKILQNDRDHWRQRTQDIISKYNRVDPAELEGMKEQLDTLQKERDEAVVARDALQSEIDTVPDQIKVAKDQQRTALSDQFKTQMRTRVGQKQTELDTANADKTALQQELDEVREQLESARNHLPETKEVQSNGEPVKSPGEVENGDEERVAVLEAAIQQKDQQIATLQTEQKAKEDQLKAHLSKKFSEFKQEANTAKETALQELRVSLAAKHAEEIEALRAELASAADAPKAATGPSDNATTTPGDNTSEVSDEQLMAISVDKWKWAAKNVPSLKTLLTNSIRSQLEKAKAASQSSEGSNAASPEQLEAVREQMEAALDKKHAEFEAEKEALEKQYQERFDKEKQELEAAHEQALEDQKLGFSGESARKIEEQIKAAEAMAAQKATELTEKKSQLKINMTNNRANAAAAKLKVVEDAAITTPDRAVGEVWEEAKVAKAAPAPKPAPAPSASTGPPAAVPTELPTQQPEGASTELAQPAEEAKVEVEPSQPPQQPAAPTQPASTQPTPSGPAKPNVGTGPSALRNISGLPRGASGIARGQRGGSQIARGASTGIPRGAPARGGRGGGRSVSMGGQNQRGGMAGSPTRGGMNPGANQFIPGAKRAREDGDGADGGQKRLRGGGHGS